MGLSKFITGVGDINSHGVTQRVHEGIDAHQPSATSVSHQIDQTLRNFRQFYSGQWYQSFPAYFQQHLYRNTEMIIELFRLISENAPAR